MNTHVCIFCDTISIQWPSTVRSREARRANQATRIPIKIIPPSPLFTLEALLLFLYFLSLPHSLDRLSDTNIIGLKLVQTNTDSDSSQVQPPPENLAQAGISLLGDVVDDDLLEAHVGVEEHGGAEDGIHGGVEGARGKGDDGDGDEAGGEEAFEGPVV